MILQNGTINSTLIKTELPNDKIILNFCIRILLLIWDHRQYSDNKCLKNDLQALKIRQ